MAIRHQTGQRIHNQRIDGGAGVESQTGHSESSCTGAGFGTGFNSVGSTSTTTVTCRLAMRGDGNVPGSAHQSAVKDVRCMRWWVLARLRSFVSCGTRTGAAARGQPVIEFLNDPYFARRSRGLGIHTCLCMQLSGSHFTLDVRDLVLMSPLCAATTCGLMFALSLAGLRCWLNVQ